MRGDAARFPSGLTAERQPPCQPQGLHKACEALGPGSREGRERVGVPGVLVSALSRCLFPWPGRGSVDESQLLKITRLSIIPSATLWDSVFRGPSFSLGTRAMGKEGRGCSCWPRPGAQAQRPGPTGSLANVSSPHPQDPKGLGPLPRAGVLVGRWGCLRGLQGTRCVGLSW